MTIAAGRMVFAAVVLLPAALSARRRREKQPPWRLALLAGIALALHFSTWISSLQYTTMAASTVIVTSNPVWVAVIDAIQRRRLPSRLTSLGLTVCMAGALALAWSNNAPSAHASAPLLGNSLALLGAWSATAYYLMGRQAQSSGASLTSMATWIYASAALVLAALSAATGSIQRIGQPGVWPWLLALALVPQLVGHTSFHWAMKHRSATAVTSVILLEPIGATALGFVFFSESPEISTLLSGGVLLLGVWLTTLGERGRVEESPSRAVDQG
ncbi:MAG: DMT family transporter [Deltaproteobacteria bacterium]|nr:DMT family transporter [Deltaproteobacteria bacterium]